MNFFLHIFWKWEISSPFWLAVFIHWSSNHRKCKPEKDIHPNAKTISYSTTNKTECIGQENHRIRENANKLITNRMWKETQGFAWNSTIFELNKEHFTKQNIYSQKARYYSCIFVIIDQNCAYSSCSTSIDSSDCLSHTQTPDIWTNIRNLFVLLYLKTQIVHQSNS